MMIIRIKNSAALLILSTAVALPASVSAYYAQVNNAHVDFISSNTNSASSAVETVDDRSSLQHNNGASLWSTLEDALEQKKTLGYAAPKIMDLFEEWVTQFEKEYETVEEKSKRMLVWLENHVLIETVNAKKLSFTLGHNEFSDMTHTEFKKRMGLGEFAPELIHREGKVFNFMEYNEEDEDDEVEELSNSRLRGAESKVEAAVERKLQGPVPINPANTPTATDKDEKDWHELGLMGPIRQQGLCGACWAFSAIGSIESAMAIDKYSKMTPDEQAQLVQTKVNNDLGIVVPLSEQNLIDCDTLHENGCQGGLMTTTFEEEEIRKGICTEVDYPFLQSQGTCASDLCTPVPGSIVKNHVDIVPRKTKALKEALKVKPVTAAMVATDPMFQFYKAGIYQVDGCGKVTKQMGEMGCNILYENQEVCLPDINHGVLVVGYGKDDTATTDLKTFFKVKNSWGDAWGEGGYFRLARWEEDKTDPTENWGECAILTLLSYPVME